MTAVARPSHHKEASLLSVGASRSLFVGTVLVVLLAMLLGGGTRQGLWSDAIVQLAGLVLLGSLALSRSPARLLPDDAWLRVLLAGLILLPILQLIDLPSSLWSLLPGRAPIAATFDEASSPRPWLPVSLDPGSTARAALALIPALAVFLATIQLDDKARRTISLLFICLGLFSVLLGLAQLMQGSSSPLRFYPFTNSGDSVGFFANRNHYAISLAALIPIVAVWALNFTLWRSGSRYLSIAVWLIVYAALLLGIGMARSRAGVVLAGLAAVMSLALAGYSDRAAAKRGRAFLMVALAVGIVLVLQFAFLGLAGRFEADPLEDYRFTIANVSFGVIWSYFPIGSGFGTYEAVYRMAEPVATLLSAYVNHAHNDWLELLVEGGLPAALLLLGFVAWFLIRGAAVWRPPAGAIAWIDLGLQRAATIAVLVILLHATVEYPLRTTAISGLFAFCLALLIRPKAGLDNPPRQSAEASRHRSRSLDRRAHSRSPLR